MAVATLRAALESERSGLQRIDASIKRIVQAPAPVPRHNSQDRYKNGGEAPRPRVSGIGAGEEATKRRHDTKTVFSRLSRNTPDSDNEDSSLGKKPRLSSHVTRDLPSKQEIMKVQCGDEQAKVRNRRMFGSLLGTLQRFKQDELSLRTQEEKKATVERRIEQQAIHEKEQHRRERQRLFAEREMRKARIRALEAKLARASERDVWVAAQLPLGGFLRTRTTPPLCWLPAVIDERTQERLDAVATQHAQMMEKKRNEFEEELTRIEDRCLRSVKKQEMKENKMEEQSGSDDELNHTDKSSSEIRVKQENGASEEQERGNDEDMLPVHAENNLTEKKETEDDPAEEKAKVDQESEAVPENTDSA